jgi:tetratricopeptide (TPR) repeat protein
MQRNSFPMRKAARPHRQMPEMEISTPITKPTMGRTFFVATSILGIVALIQLGAVGYVFIKRFHAAPPPVLANANVPAPLPKPTPVGTEKLDVNDTFAEPPASIPKPTPVAAAPAPTIESRLTEMIEQARLLRDRGDTNTAMTRLREAQVISPENALIISEMAVTFEKMGMTDKALEQWRRIYDMGETAGIYYAAADAKLKASEALAKQQAAEKEVAEAAKEPAGFQPGAVLGLGEIAKTAGADPKRFSVKIPIKSRPASQVEVRDVVIQVFFYDMLPDATIVQTNANVSSRWSTLPADWADGDIEVLDVEYAQQADDPKDKAHTERKFFGYVIRVYYKSELQAYSAEPVKLLKQYPPPLTLESDG